MGCNEPKYHDVIQLEAGISGFKKTSLTMSFISEYMAFCRTSEIAFPWIANLYGNNYPGFIAHRGDQSVLTNLKIKYNLYSCSGNHIIRQLVRCNVNGKSFKAWNE